TYGEHIVFGNGFYAPHTNAGKHLLGHELVHTLQQGNMIRRKWDVPEEKWEDADLVQTADEELEHDPEVMVEFTKANPALTKAKLEKWIHTSIERGWRKGTPAPDANKPTISYNEKDELVVEAIAFRGSNGAFNTASTLLPKNIGAKFIWKERFTGNEGEYTMDYADDSSYKNLLAYEKSKDVDFEALRIVSENLSDYEEVKNISDYRTKLLSKAMLRLVASAQHKLYPGQVEKHTGFLDPATKTDLAAKVKALEEKRAADKQKIEDEKKAAQLSDAMLEEKKEDDRVLQTGAFHDQLQVKIDALVKAIHEPAPMAILAAEKAGGIPLLPIPNIPVELLYRISQHFVLGFLRQLRTVPEEKIKDGYTNLI
ncbi:MAG: DUF4157 domain-containing protein, partial [Pedobacter sp.]